MKTKFFFLVILFLAIGAMTYAQTEAAAPTDKKDAPAQVATPEQGKTMDCPGHQAGAAKADCKWVDADKDGKCDTCGKTEKECKDACKAESTMKGCDPASCMGNKGSKSGGCCSSKEPKK